jgi:hypothetical protein
MALFLSAVSFFSARERISDGTVPIEVCPENVSLRSQQRPLRPTRILHYRSGEEKRFCGRQ